MKLLMFLLVFTVITVKAQTSLLRINPNIILPKDSAESSKLTASLEGLLVSARGTNEENSYVYDSEKVETFILLDELKGIEKSEKYSDEHFYKPYLTNVIRLKDTNYVVQLSYIGIVDGLAFLRASFEFIAHRTEDSFRFSSPLLQNTEHWKTLKTGNNIFHYQASINKGKVREFNAYTRDFDRKLGSGNIITEYYCCDNLSELEKLTGVQYKSDYNGRSESTWSSIFGNRKIVVLGNNNSCFDDFDPHDLFHDRLSTVVPRSKVNKPVDEGCAYLYGGSWGLSWKEIFTAFKEQVATSDTISWTDIKENPVYFKTREFKNSADYIVNALLVKKIENEKGFKGVWELLNVGPYEKGNEKYYSTLEKLTGITKKDYNASITELINNEKF
jgi:hypothetical protein